MDLLRDSERVATLVAAVSKVSSSEFVVYARDDGKSTFVEFLFSSCLLVALRSVSIVATIVSTIVVGLLVLLRWSGAIGVTVSVISVFIVLEVVVSEAMRSSREGSG